MGVDIGTVRGEEITTNKDGEGDVRLLQVELSNPDDLQTVEMVGPPGDDSAPQPGDRVVVIELSPSYRVAIAFEDGITPAVLPGEKKIYSFDDTFAVQAFIKLEVDGTITIENDSGGQIVMDGASGQVAINSNLTVDI